MHMCAHKCVFFSFFFFLPELAAPLGPVGPEQEPAVPSQPVEIEIETTEERHKRQKKCVRREGVMNKASHHDFMYCII